MAKQKHPDPHATLTKLIEAASPRVLGDLVRRLAQSSTELERRCLEFLRERVSLSADAAAETEGEVFWLLWAELENDLSELDAYGGGPDEQEERAAEHLDELAERVREGTVPREDRRALLDELLPYIASRNSGMEDQLYDVAYAACHDDEDLRDLAARLERLGQDWSLEHARRIYRSLGDREKYLALRARKMIYGLDYYDLVTYYWEAGEQERAVAVAREGLANGQGRKEELRLFLAERAAAVGDRSQFLELQFAQATERLTATGYERFRELCSDSEWTAYEPRLLEVLARCRGPERLQIHMLRGEYEQALAVLTSDSYPYRGYGDSTIMRTAAQLEARFPEQILAFYRSVLGRTDLSQTRGEYARQAAVALKMHRVWVDVLQASERWRAFARGLKQANARRPAFQEEFARVVPEWREL